MATQTKDNKKQLKFSIEKSLIFKEDMSDFYPMLGVDPSSDISIAKYYEETLEHYPLLRHISNRISNCRILDGGTAHGISSLALCGNKTNHIDSYDIADLRNGRAYLDKQTNTSYYIKSVLDLTDEELNSYDFMFIDLDPHDGIQERKLTDRLLNIKFQGFCLMDDIHLNLRMREWWDSLPGAKRDLTRVGHHTGSGLWVPPNCPHEITIYDYA